MRRLFLRLFLFLALLTSGSVSFAADQYWDGVLVSGSHVKNVNPDPVCRTVYTDAIASGGFPNTSYLGVYSQTATNAICKAIYTNAGTTVTVQTINHLTCPTATPYFNGSSCVGTAPPPPVCVAGPIGNMDLTYGYLTAPDSGAAVAKYVIPNGSFAPVKSGGLAGVTYCSSGCEVQPSAHGDSMYYETTPGLNGYYRLIEKNVPMSRNGGTCTSDNTVPPSTAGGNLFPDPSDVTGSQSPPSVPNTSKDGSCPSGSVPIGQDPYGMTICQGKTTPPPTSSGSTVTGPATTVTNADGSTTTSQTTTVTNADGSTTTTVKQTTTAPDGTTTVKSNTSTGSTPTGGQGTKDSPADQTDLCKQHPELNVCKNSQVTGTCGQITCTGDAIQCATLRAAAALQCQQDSDVKALASSSSTALGNSILSGADPMQSQIDSNKAGTTVDVSNPGSNMDSSGFLGGGACLADRTISVMGKTVNVKFSALCDKLSIIKPVILALAALVWIFIVAGGLTSTNESSIGG